MKPIAKAENLIEKFIPNTRIWNDEKKIWEDCIESAKRCALIVQKNLLNKLKELNIVDEFEEEVLFEINAL